MSRRRNPAIVEAPLAVASDGAILVNAIQLGSKTDLDALVAYAEVTGLSIFVGVVVPARLRGRFTRELDDMSADVVGRLAPRLVRKRRTP